MVLVLPEWVALNLPTKLALKPKFNWVVVLVLPKWVAPNRPTEPALKPKFDWVVGCEPAKLPGFCCLLPTPRGANMMFGFVPGALRPMAATSVPPGDVVIALAFAFAVAAVAVAATCVLLGDKGIALAFAATATAAAMFVGGEVGVCSIVGVA
jgi:hypothetical protein